ncbi:GLIPR1-like protein 1 isoform X2 [Centruroides vittatus]|uniref:GLIPR1-like protein 1 isoform X2 n=1 Tax=Centruroides vittatus TaxID=120091 RepID=UPI0035106340
MIKISVILCISGFFYEIEASLSQLYRNSTIEESRERKYKNLNAEFKTVNKFSMINYNGFTQDEENGILSTHSLSRFMPPNQPLPSNMVKLVWNDALAKTAKDWGDYCTDDFGPRECENIFSQNRGFYNESGSYEDVLRTWFNEKSYYVYATNECKLSCDRYKLMVWAEAHSIGCSKSKCKIEKRTKYLVICNYYPPMKDMSIRPYKNGSRCSGCDPTLYECGREFCEKKNIQVPEKELSECNTLTTTVRSTTEHYCESYCKNYYGAGYRNNDNIKLLLFIIFISYYNIMQEDKI